MRTLNNDMTFNELQEERTYTFARLQTHPLTEHLAPPFAVLEEDRLRLGRREAELLEQKILTLAMVDVIDDKLALFVLVFDHDLLAIVKNDRSASLYKRFFGNRQPSRLRRMPLGERLEILRSWPKTLAELPQAELRRHGEALGPLIGRADEAIQARSQAEQALIDFYAVGEYKSFVDRFNAQRKLTFGKLGELVHAHPEENLGSEFAEQFFLRERRSRPPTIEGVKQTIARLERDLGAERDLLMRLEREQAQTVAARTAAERAAALMELARVEAAAQQAMARAAELRASLEKQPRPTP